MSVNNLNAFKNEAWKRKKWFMGSPAIYLIVKVVAST